MGRTIPLNEELQRRVRELYVPHVFTEMMVAKELGISRRSVQRYRHEDGRERDRASSRAWKASVRGVCERCGGETRYNGRTINGASRICDTCAHTFTHCEKGHPYTPENLLDSSQGRRCRICRNTYAREYQARRRRAAGIPEKRPYRKRVEERLLASISNSEI